MKPFRMGEYWYAKIEGRLICCESYEKAWELMDSDQDSIFGFDTVSEVV